MTGETCRPFGNREEKELMDQQCPRRAVAITGAGTASGSPAIEIAGKTVHRLGFGTMRLVGPGRWGEPADGRPYIRLRACRVVG
jgi:hypothetical protein